MILAVFIFMLSSVYALGVTPARTTIDFERNLVQTIEYEVLTGDTETNLVIAAQGDLAEFISIPLSMVNVPAAQGSVGLSYSINLPNSMEPGLSEGEVVILELPSGGQTSKANVRATLAVVTQLHVYVPYPGKYANARMNVISRPGGATFVFPVVSAGEFDLTSVRANVDIFNKLGEKVDSFTTGSIAVASGAKKEIVYEWDSDAPVGNYRAVASLIYDDGTLSLEEEFSVGSAEIELQDITVEDFNLGEIAKLEMLVENKWSDPIIDAYVETKIYNDQGEVVSEFKSASYDVDALSKEVFVSYWDTAGVRVGTYETEVSIVYGDSNSLKSLKFQVEENDLTIIGLGYVISAEGVGGGNTLMMILIIMVGVLILINILWFFFFRRKMK